jgi:hypothetical protein
MSVSRAEPLMLYSPGATGVSPVLRCQHGQDLRGTRPHESNALLV